MSHRSGVGGVVFTCDRPQALERCLTALLPQDGLDAISVYDDSRRPAAARRNGDLIARLRRRFRRPIVHIRRSDRRPLARWLAAATGVSPEVVRFGLFGLHGAMTTIGANRNAMLITLAGDRVIACDDDVVPRVGELPFASGAGMQLVAARSAPHSRFLRSHQAALDQAHWLDRSIASLHAPVLGRSVRQVALDHGARPEPGPALPVAARVVVSTTGIAGDNYSVSPKWNPVRNDGALRSITSAAEYRAATTCCHLVEGMSRPTLSRPAIAPFFHVGLDVGELVPPFLPVARREDNLFMTLLAGCRPDAWHVTWPLAVEHARVDRKAAPRSAVWKDMGDLSTVDFVWHLLAPAPAAASTPADAMRASGAAIAASATQPRRSFEAQMIEAGRDILVRRARQLERLRDRHVSAPPHWSRDIERQIAEALRQSDHAAHCLPSDLVSSTRRADRTAALHETLSLYAQLLAAWPSLFEAAAAVRG